MKKFFLIGITCIFISCKGKKTVADQNNTSDKTNFKVELKHFVLEKIAKMNSSEELLKNYPDADIKEGVGMFDEGTVERAFTILYPNTKNEIHLIWHTIDKKKLHQVYLSNNGDWRSNKSIRIGTTYNELVAINGKPIHIYGFGWDYGGAVDWNGGNLKNSKLQVFLKPIKQPNTKFYGDRIINPNEEELKELDLSVAQIIYQLGNE